MNTLKVDLHAHIADHYDLVWNQAMPVIGGRSYPGFLNRSDYDPVKVLGHSLDFSKHTLLGIINFEDKRAQGTISAIERNAEKSIQLPTIREGNLLTVFGNERIASFWAGREYRTKQGDVLVLGMTDDLKSDDMEYVVWSANQRQDTLVLIPHANKYGKLGANQKTIERLRGYIHGVDSREIAKNLSMPFYTSSDSHTLSEAFSSHMILQVHELLYTTSIPMLIKKGLKDKKMVSVEGKNSKLEELRHISSCVVALAGLKTGLIKRENKSNI